MSDKAFTSVTAPATNLVRPSGLHQWGAAIARRRWLVLGVWLVLLIAAAVSYPGLQHRLQAPDYGVNGAQSTRAEQLIARYFPQRGAEQDVIVFYSPATVATSPAYRQVVTRVIAATRGAEGVNGVISPYAPGATGQIAAGGHAAIALIGLSGDSGARASHARVLQDRVKATAHAPVKAWLTGYSPVANDLTSVEDADASRAESIGIPVALIVLLLALGSLVAAVLPLALAGVGLMSTFGVIALLSSGLRFDAFILTIATMIGTGVGIDYALFIVSRFREELARHGVTSRRDHDGIANATGAALATSGRTVIVSGIIVAVSLCSLFIVNAPVFHEIAIGVLVVVGCTLAAALTLLPAALAALGPAVNRAALPTRMRPADARTAGLAETGGWARWAHTVMRHPVVGAVLATGVLLILAAPVGAIHYGINLGTSALTGTPSGKANQVLARSFSPGLLAPVDVLLTSAHDGPLDQAGSTAANRMATALRSDSRVAAVATEMGSGRMIIDVVPAVPVDSAQALNLVTNIRTGLTRTIARPAQVQVLVGGATAEFADLSHETRVKLPAVVGLVLGLSLLLLLFVFRSIALPVKAVAMNLLATSAAIGTTVAVFQWGHGQKLLGFTSTGFLQVYLPITVFALLFGLSMDYEVFLIRRMQEAWNQQRDNAAAVAAGIAHTARPITAAAMIMAAVFGSFLSANVLELKQFGLALAVAILLDALLVRLVLVPALMRLLGHWNWWLPAGLERRLPVIRAD